jgi:hypothetical protein
VLADAFLVRSHRPPDQKGVRVEPTKGHDDHERIATGKSQRTKSERVGADGFSTRYKISSNRPNAGLWMVLQGRSEAGCQSVAIEVAFLTRRRRANAWMREQPGQSKNTGHRTAGPKGSAQGTNHS